MNRIFQKIFLTTLTVVSLGLILTGIIIGLSASQYWVIILMGIVMSFVLSTIIGKLYLMPIKQLQKVTEKMTRGDFKSRLSFMRKDEWGDLAHSLNQMSVELQDKVAQIMQDKNELQAIVSSMVEGVIVIGKDERIILLSAPVYDMLDLRSKDTIGRPYWELIRNAEINSLLKEAINHKKSLNKEITIISPQEAHFNMQVSCVLSEENQLSGVVAVFHDITELKKLEKLRSEFVANVSHELKTPLTTIKGFVETLRDEDLNDKERAKKFLTIIQKHTVRLENLVNDLLSLSALESNEVELNLEKTQVPELIEAVVELCRDQSLNRQHKVVINLDKGLPLILADQAKIEQVFLNLLDNAIKFTPPGGMITIQAAQDNGFVRIDFRDTGVGIAPEHLSRIFERFYRVDGARSRDFGGTGLGLSIVKHIVQVHHGKVAVESFPEKGSVFSVFLPIQPATK